MTATTFIGHFLGPDTHTNRPSATGLANGTLYVCTTHQKIERVVAGAWVDYATLGAPAGTGVVATDPIWDTKGDLAVATGADAASKLVVGTNGQVLTADSAQTTGVKWATPATGSAGALTLLSTTTLSSAGNFDITSISGSYNDLVVVLIGRTTGAGTFGQTVGMTLNNDSGTNYSTEKLQAAGTSATAAESASATQVDYLVLPQNGNTAGFFGVITLTIYGYASTTWVKMIEGTILTSYAMAAGNHVPVRTQTVWNSTAAVNRITVPVGVNLVTGSQLRIYGRT